MPCTYGTQLAYGTTDTIPDPMKTQDQPIVGLVSWYLELEDRYLALIDETETVTVEEPTSDGDGPLSRPEHL